MKQSRSAQISELDSKKDMNAGFDSDNSANNKSVSIKIESIDQNPHFKFIDNEGHQTKRVNVLMDNLSR